jgi:hypothetical protein
LRTAVNLYTELGNSQAIAVAEIPLGVISAVRGDPEAIDLLSAGIATLRPSGDSWSLAFGLLNMGGTLLLLDRDVEAVAPLQEAITLSRAMNADIFLIHALINLGWARLKTAEHGAAKEALVEAVQRALALDNNDGTARGLDALAALAVSQDRPVQGAVLVGAAKNVRERVGARVFGTDRGSLERTTAQLRDRLGETRFTNAVRKGAALDREALVRAATRV